MPEKLYQIFCEEDQYKSISYQWLEEEENKVSRGPAAPLRTLNPESQTLGKGSSIEARWLEVVTSQSYVPVPLPKLAGHSILVTVVTGLWPIYQSISVLLLHLLKRI